MKKLLLALVALFLVVAILGAATWTIGKMTEDGMSEYMADLDSKLEGQSLSFQMPQYGRGFFKSESTTVVHFEQRAIESEVGLKHEIYHGPLALTPDGMKLGLSYVVTTLDRESMSEDSREILRELWGDEEPFTVTTLVGMGGERESVLEAASVSVNEGDRTIRFDGANGRFLVAADESSVAGGLEISEFTMRSRGQGTPEGFKLGASHLNVDYEEGTKLMLDGKVGSLSLSMPAPDGGMLVYETKGMEVKSDLKAVPGYESILAGTASFEVLEAAFDRPDQPEMKFGGLSVNVGIKESGGFVESDLSYRLKSFEGSIAPPGDEAAALSVYLDLLQKGMELSGHSRFPAAVAQKLAEAQQSFGSSGFGAEMSAEDSEQMALLVEEVLRNSTKGTGFGFQMTAGTGEEAASVKVDFTYSGERPVTANKTYQELLANSALKSSLTIPMTVAQANPQVMERLSMMIAMGTLRQTGNSLQATLELENGTLTTNGAPNPIFEQFAPLLQQEIGWDAMFQSMRQSTGAE